MLLAWLLPPLSAVREAQSMIVFATNLNQVRWRPIAAASRELCSD
jgi:hypothetical protein